MTARTPTHGIPTWVDISTTDQARTMSFYSDLFGWTADEPDPDLGCYTNFRRDGETIAGCVPAMEGVPSDIWSTYFATDDADKTAELTAGSGGAVIAPPMDVADLGRMAVFTDPGHNGFGIWQAGTHTGFAVTGEPGSPSWFELHTRSYDQVLRFYTEVFGWTTSTASDVPGFRYTVLTSDGEDRAGVMDASGFLAEGDEGGWRTYWHTDDLAATLKDVKRLGGALVNGPDDTPYGVLAECTDVTGAIFKLRTPPAG